MIKIDRNFFLSRYYNSYTNRDVRREIETLTIIRTFGIWARDFIFVKQNTNTYISPYKSSNVPEMVPFWLCWDRIVKMYIYFNDATKKCIFSLSLLLGTEGWDTPLPPPILRERERERDDAHPPPFFLIYHFSTIHYLGFYSNFGIRHWISL